MKINRKDSALILLTLIAAGAVMGGVLLSINASNPNSNNTGNTTTTVENLGPGFGERLGGCNNIGAFGRHGMNGGFGQFEVSAEYNQTVTNIAENDSDIQNLISQGYNITSIRPIIKEVIDGQGNLTAKATTAIVVLTKDTSGYARALVDISQNKVTEIVILTKKIIQK